MTSIYSKNTYNAKKPNEAWSKIFAFITPRKRLLDIGCSSGELGAALKKAKQVYVVGLDITEADINLAKQNLDEAYVANIEQDDVAHLGKFDIILFADVLEHLMDPVTALKRVKPLLNPGGKVVFSIPNMANVTTRVALLKGRFEYKDFGVLDRTHLHYYDRQEVDRIFRDAGYEIKATDNTIRGYPRPILEKELAPIGITVTEKLLKFLTDLDAATYQFIGNAVPAKQPATYKPQSTSPLDSISHEIDALTAAMGRQDQQLVQLKAELSAATAERDEAKNHLKEILNSKAWKLATKLRNARLKIIPKKRS